MPSYVPAKKNTAFVFYAALEDQANAGLFKSSPTLAAGDFKVSIDGGALANLTTLPTNTPGGVMVKFSLSADEMNGDNITVVCIDAAGAEWYDLVVNIQTSARQIDDLATPTNITAGTITTVTNLTNLPAAAALEASVQAVPTAAEIVAAIDADPPSVNVTLWKGADATTAVLGADGDTLETLSDQLDATATAAALATVDAIVDAILEDTGTTLPGLFAASGASVTVISAVDGGTITLHIGDTWMFTVSDSTLDLADYEMVALVVKRTARQIDNDALLYLRSDTGLARIGGAAPVSAGNGELTNTATSFTGTVALAETSAAGLIAGQYTWWLKAFDTTPAPDEGYTLATGAFVLERAGLAAVA